MAASAAITELGKPGTLVQLSMSLHLELAATVDEYGKYTKITQGTIAEVLRTISIEINPNWIIYGLLLWCPAKQMYIKMYNNFRVFKVISR